MKIRTIAAALLSTALLGAGVLAPASASAGEPEGTRSLAEVLTADGNQFDHNGFDYDLLTEAVLAVLAEKPDSTVAALTDGNVALTAFLPNDYSFRLLTKELTGRFYWTEKATFEALAGAAGIDTIEQVLLYHVVPGVTIDSATALQSDGAELTTATTLPDPTFTVDVLSKRFGLVKLRDNDTSDYDPVLAPGRLDINKGNKQIAHGIFLVLRPIDLP